MRIQIKQKLRPFSHRASVRAMIPESTWEAQVFPTKAILRDLSSSSVEEIELPFGGPMPGFTILQDLERARIEIFGRGKKRVFITADSHPSIKKIPMNSCQKRLSLGVSKKQDWDLIARRADMAEIFPFWLRQSQLIPVATLPSKPIGTSRLLEEGKLDLFFHAGFQGILSPRLQDENFLGIIPDEKIDSSISPIGLIHEGARLIEALFFLEDKETIHFLPKLPKEFHAGRFIHLQTSKGDRIDIEWSKKELKKVIIYPNADQIIKLGLQKSLKSFRLRTDLRKKGRRLQRNESLELHPHQALYLDRFMH